MDIRKNYGQTDGPTEERAAHGCRDTETGIRMAGRTLQGRPQSGNHQQGSQDNGGKATKYNVAALGEVPPQRKDGSFCILVCQMSACYGKEVRELKITATERLINKYKINLSVFMELNYN